SPHHHNPNSKTHSPTGRWNEAKPLSMQRWEEPFRNRPRAILCCRFTVMIRLEPVPLLRYEKKIPLSYGYSDQRGFFHEHIWIDFISIVFAEYNDEVLVHNVK
ncbi:unnamed protein product, partial [Sphacelaria rigidula]